MISKVVLSVLVIFLSGCGADGDSEKSSPNLIFETEGTVYSKVGEPFSNPLMTVPVNANVEYQSSNELVAKVNKEGEVQLVDEGITVITASMIENSTFISDSASYELVVKKNYLKCTTASDVSIVKVKNNEFEYDLRSENCFGFQDFEHKKKSLEIKVLIPDERILVSEFAVATINPFDNYIYTSYKAQNISDQTICFIRANGIKIKNDTGINQITDNPINYSYIEGSLHQLSGKNIFTNNCLKSTEVGHFVDLLTVSDSELISQLEISSFDYIDSSVIEVPQVNALSLKWDAGLNRVSADFENNTGSVIKTGFSRVIYYDEDGDITHSNFIFSEPSRIDKSANFVLSDDTYRNFKAIKVKINLDYELVNNSNGVTSLSNMLSGYVYSRHGKTVVDTNLEFNKINEYYKAQIKKSTLYDPIRKEIR